jgi:hypothetical protein
MSNADSPLPRIDVSTLDFRGLRTSAAHGYAYSTARMIFFPDYPGRLEGDWRPQTLGPEDVWLTSSDGTKLRYWWVSEPNARFTFLAFHGNLSNIANRAPTHEFLRPTRSTVCARSYLSQDHSCSKSGGASTSRSACKGCHGTSRTL